MIPIYEQIVEQVKALIRNGKLKENDNLPSVRSLAKELKISALTVKKAYDSLENEGFTVTIHGKGTYVTATNTELLLEEQKKELESDLERVIQKGRCYGISDEDIKKLAYTFNAFQGGTLEDVKGFCAVATTKEIAKQDYILTPGRYVGIEEQEDDGEPFEEKMKRLTSELSDMFAKSHELEEEIRRKLGAIGYELK